MTALHIALAAVLAGPTAAQAPFDPGGLVLCDFETEADLARWSPRSLTSLELTEAWSPGGDSSAAVTYREWSEGQEQWPAIVATVRGGGLSASDFSLYDTLEWDAYNPGDQPAQHKLHLTDGEKRFVHVVEVEPGSQLHVSVPMRKIAAAINATAVTELHFYVTQPDHTYTWYLDNLRLGIELLEPARALAHEAARLDEDTTRFSEGAALDDARAVRRMLGRVGGLRERIDTAVDLIESGGVETYQDVLDAREVLAEFEAELTEVQAVRPALKAARFLKKRGGGEFALAAESSMTKVFLEAGRLESDFAASYDLSAARNEHESFQTIVFPVAGDLDDVTWELSPIRNKRGQEIPATVRVVGYVDCKQPSYTVPHGGWWPDPLLDYAAGIEEVPFGEVLPLWVTLDVPPAAKPGIYHGKLTVRAKHAKPQSMGIRLQVWDFTLPEHTHLKTALSWRSMNPNLHTGLSPGEALARYEDWMLEEYYLNPGNIYGGPPAWTAERLRELIDNGLNAINLAYFNAPREPDYDADAYWKRYEELVAKIEAYLPVIDEAGARDLCYIYCFDERPVSQLDVVFETARKLKARWPDIEVMTTAYDVTFGMEREGGEAMDIWVPLTPKFDTVADNIAAAQRKGRDIWWYICIGPQHPYPNWFIEYPAIEGRLIMGAMTAKYQPGGFLYYAVDRWPVNTKVCEGAPRTDWDPASYKNNNGDGSVMVAGPNGPLATLRLENIRDGIEDYEYYVLLRELAKRPVSPEGIGEVSASVVQDLTHFTYDPEVLLRERDRVAEAILTLSGKPTRRDTSELPGGPMGPTTGDW